MKMPKLVLLLIVFITACTPTAPVAQEAVLSSSSPTSSPSTVHTPKNTKRPPRPTSTKAPTRTRRPTSTITLTPTITGTITPYPTFDVNDIKTHIPFPSAVCPPENPDYQFPTRPSNDSTHYFEESSFIQNNLKSGASLSQIYAEIEKVLQGEQILMLKDISGDGVPELIVPRSLSTLVIGCAEGQYRTLLDYNVAWEGGNHGHILVAEQDMNLNGLPDVVLMYRVMSSWDTAFDILEWDGVQFNSLIQANHGENSANTSILAKALYWYTPVLDNWASTTPRSIPIMHNYTEMVIRDVDKNGTKELILRDYGPEHLDTLSIAGRDLPPMIG